MPAREGGGLTTGKREGNSGGDEDSWSEAHAMKVDEEIVPGGSSLTTTTGVKTTSWFTGAGDGNVLDVATFLEARFRRTIPKPISSSDFCLSCSGASDCHKMPMLAGLRGGEWIHLVSRSLPLKPKGMDGDSLV
uniref:Uncharacterized protein n=1 Tax=Oryza nivara TaxID=4536 RepID=A0A0E0FV21_ORYNI